MLNGMEIRELVKSVYHATGEVVGLEPGLVLQFGDCSPLRNAYLEWIGGYGGSLKVYWIP